MNQRVFKRIAERLAELMRPHCVRVEIAGSVRRGCAEINDIEIVAIPKETTQPLRDLFGYITGYESRSVLVEEFIKTTPNIQWIKTGTSDIIPLDIDVATGSKYNCGFDRRYWRGLIKFQNQNIKLDLFLASRDNFGAIYLIRTGSKGFNMMMIKRLKSRGFNFQDGFLVKINNKGETVDTVYCPEEKIVFEAAGCSFFPPEKRN